MLVIKIKTQVKLLKIIPVANDSQKWGNTGNISR